MDEHVVVRAQQGDHDAFAELVEGIADRLHAAAQGILRDVALAEDATQGALLQVWRDLPKLREPGRFEAWSYRILVRAAYAEARRARRDRVEPIADHRAQPVVADGTSLVVDRDQLERAFGRLSLEQRTVIVLRHVLELPLESVADALGVPLHTARSRLYHAMRAMRAAIDADARVVPSAPETRRAIP